MTSPWSSPTQSPQQEHHLPLARAAYADMLHDHERHTHYATAITSAIAHFHSLSKPAIVLDIGTGTGLLSMMAAAAGADEIYACESFPPMAAIAAATLKSNHFSPKIHLIRKPSTHLKIPTDLPHKCNILVTETFDTELIGEDCIETYNHANRELMQANSLYIPASATIYLQPVNSPQLLQMNTLPFFPDCPGVNSLHDIQLSHLRDYTPLSPPIPSFQFDLSKQIPTSRSVNIPVDPSNPPNSLLFFWDLHFKLYSSSSSITITCDGRGQWREHWIQAAYHVPSEFTKKNSLKFTQTESSFHLGETQFDCTCGLHREIGSRNRIFRINQLEKEFGTFFKKLFFGKVIFLSDFSLLPSMIQCEDLEVLSGFRGVCEEAVPVFLNDQRRRPKTTTIIGEPSFASSSNTLEDAEIWWRKVKSIVQERNLTDFELLPRKTAIRALLVNFHHLYKTHSPPVGEITVHLGEGDKATFNLSHFDAAIAEAKSFDPFLQSVGLYEYDFDVLGEFDVFDLEYGVDFVEGVVDVVDEKLGGKSNGIIIYPVWDFGGTDSAGKVLKSSFDDGSKKFHVGTVQAVGFLEGSSCSSSKKIKIKYSIDSGFQVILLEQPQEVALRKNLET